MNVPKTFISYSWDNEEHKKRVASIATRLRGDGVEVILDQWDVVPGDQLPEFMEREIRENDYILIMCTPKYKVKSDAREGGVGYEGDIMTAEVFSKGNNRKFIPVLVSGTWDASAPSWLVGKYYIDLSNDAHFERGYQDLITTIHGQRPKAPPIGKKPDLTENVVSGQQKPKIEEIKIEGVIVDEVTSPRMDGTSGSALYKVPFRLTRTPTSRWSELFIQTWNRPPRYTTMHRPRIASVIGDKIILDGTTIEEVEKYHRDTLVLCVDVANEEENKLKTKELRRQEEERQRQEAHKNTVNDVSKRLKF